jgi:hypothetical protein
MSLTDTLAQSIATMEGFFQAGTLAQRNNNPGNLRAGAGQVGTDANGFAIFPDVQTGWSALYRQISLDSSRGLDLSGFITKYAPPSQNDTGSYLNYLTGQLGVPSTTLLSDLGAGDAGNPPQAPRPSTGEPSRVRTCSAEGAD